LDEIYTIKFKLMKFKYENTTKLYTKTGNLLDFKSEII
jgi:hypothetical protein